MSKQTQVIVYTDGACSGNPGKGGWAAILISGKNRKEISGAFRFTTNNRMEIFAVIMALKALKKKCNVKIHTDSQLIFKTINEGWAKRWKANNWKRNKKDKALNPDLWDILLNELEKQIVEFVWVPGHEGVTENENCDKLAVKAAASLNCEIDFEYEKVNVIS